MEPHQHARSPAPAAAAPLRPGRAPWTPAKQRAFLVALVETGSVTQAARAAGMSRSSAQRLRARLAGTPFDRAWTYALIAYAQRMSDPFGPDAKPPVRPAQR